MKLKHYLFILSLLVSFAKSGSCQIGVIHIYGKIDSSITSKFGDDKLGIRIHTTTNHYNNGEVIDVPIGSDGKYNVNINVHHKFTYLSFWMNNKKSSIPDLEPISGLLPNLAEVYLFETGDSIEFSVFKEFTIIKGKGSEKLICQSEIYQLKAPHMMHNRITSLTNARDYNSMFKLKDTFREHSIGMKLAILNSYKNTLKAEVYSRLYLDIIGLVNYEIQNEIWLYIPWMRIDQYSNQKRISTHHYYQSTINNKNDLNGVDSAYIAESAYYPELIFTRELNALRLYSSNPLWGDSFSEIYKRLKNNYQGKLREKLILICYQKLGVHFSKEARLNVVDALSIIKEEDIKNLIEEWEYKQNAAYPFELQDVNGKVHKLNDYKGKLVIMDFWFTGCSGCIYLNAAMREIIEIYKGRKDIVFLTVSTDGLKEQWIKSLKTGNYSSPGTINLYTGGKGTNHPIYKYYNFLGAPQQVIIDQNGILVSTVPPRPDANLELERNETTGESYIKAKAVMENPEAKEFMELIDYNLRKFNLKTKINVN